MKQRSTITLLTLTVVLALTAFVAGKASASTGCFTDTTGHWAETFICWVKDHGITSGTAPGIYSPEDYVTRAQMAVFLQKLDELAVTQANSADAVNLTAANNYADTSDATNLAAAKDYTDSSLSSGNILISAGFANWHPFNSTDPLSYTYFSSQTQVTRSSIGSSFLSINPDIPTVLYGRSLRFKGVEFCFDTFSSTALNYIEINTYSHATGSLGRNLRFSDPTTRTGNECHLYTLPSPIVLTADDGVNFFIQVNWSVAAAQFAIGRTTFILEPTTTIAADPKLSGTDEGTSSSPIGESTSP